MMVECPKCGFSQPEDRYCANCGVDMQQYKPSTSAWFKRWLSSAQFQISFLVVIIAGLVAYLFTCYQQETHVLPSNPVENESAFSSNQAVNPSPKQPRLVAKPTRARVELRKQNSLHGQAVTAPAKTFSARQAPTATDGGSAGGIAPTMAPKAGDAKAPKDPKDAASSAALSPQSLHVILGRLPKDSLTLILNGGHTLRETARSIAATYDTKGSMDTLQTAAQGLRVLDNVEQPLSLQNAKAPFSWVYTDAKTGQEYGMAFTLTPLSMEPQSMQLELRGFIRLKGSTESRPFDIPLHGVYHFAPQQALILAGFLPHQPISEKELGKMPGSPLRLMADPEFLENLAEFVIFIQPE